MRINQFLLWKNRPALPLVTRTAAKPFPEAISQNRSESDVMQKHPHIQHICNMAVNFLQHTL